MEFNPAVASADDFAAFIINGGYVMGGTLNPTVTPVSARRGSIYVQVATYGVGNVGMWQKQDDGASTNWQPFDGGGGAGGDIKSDGSVPFAANESMGGFLLTDLGSPVNDGDAVNKLYVDSALANIKFENLRYVSKNGNDSTGDGSVTKPYLTIVAAMAGITDASPSKRYIIFIEPGQYDEIALTLKANVSLCGYSFLQTRVTSTAPITPDASFTPAGDHRTGLYNMNMLTLVNYDMLAVSGNEGKFFASGTQFAGGLTLTAFSNINQGFLRDCDVLGAGYVQNGWNSTIQNCRLGSVTVNERTGGNTFLTGAYSTVNGNTTVNGTNQTIALSLVEFRTAGSFTATGSATTVAATLNSMPEAPAFSGGAALTLTSHAQNLNFVPGDVTDWDTVPNQVKQALDILAQTLKDDVTVIEGDITALQGDVTALQGDVTTLQGQVSTLEAESIRRDGSVNFTADQSMDGNKITDALDPTDPQDYATKAYVDSTSGGGSVPVTTNVRYVSKNGNDGTGDGSLAKPYLTIQAAINGTGATTVNNPIVILIAPGVYTESFIQIRPNMALVAMSPGSVSIVNSVTFGINQSVGAGTFNGGAIALVGIKVTSPLYDMRTTQGNAFTVRVIDCEINGSMIFYGGGPTHLFYSRNSVYQNPTSTYSLRLRSGYLFSTNDVIAYFDQRHEALDPTPRNKSEFMGSKIAVLTSTGNGTPLLESTVVLDSSPVGQVVDPTFLLSVRASVDSLDATSASEIGAILSLTSLAQNLGYSPAVSGDWITPPTQAKSALDQLASRRTIVVERVVSAPEAAAKSLTLATAPFNVNDVAVEFGGVGQVDTVDFSVTGSIVNWNGLGMDAIGVVAGDILVFTYTKG